MPFWGLVITSIGFLIPSFIAKKQNKDLTSKSFKCITITSVIYHSTQHSLSLFIDKIVVHSVSAFHLGRALYISIRDKSIKKLAYASSSLLPMYIYFKKSLPSTGIVSKLWHMAFHITGHCCLSIYAIFF